MWGSAPNGLFAIAMTLLVVGITVPALRAADDEAELARALRDLAPSFISFAISFLVIGRYWLAHHRFFSMLGAIDSRLIAINLLYLAFIAFYSVGLAVAVWFLFVPLQLVASRCKPPGTDEYLS